MIDFQHDVLDRSHQLPVLVDFWAPWCSPCRILGPIIDELASGSGGRWELAKLDTDEQPEIAQAYGVMSIPTVKLFRDGRVIAEFMGALPRSEIESWLERHLPDERAADLDRLARSWVARGGDGDLVAELETVARDNPDLPAARLRLAQAVVTTDPARARQLLDSVDVDADLLELAGDVAALVDLMTLDGDVPERIAPHLERARAALREHRLEDVLESMFELAMRDKQFGDQLARRVSVALFHFLGHDNELTDTYQRRLSMALHS